MMTELTNEDVLQAYDQARNIHLIARTGGGFDMERFAKSETKARDAVLARMAGTIGWQPLCAVADPKALGEVLLRAFYPSRETASDVYHGWYSRGDWVRWPHVFPPTHYMPVLPLPTAARSAGPGRPE